MLSRLLIYRGLVGAVIVGLFGTTARSGPVLAVPDAIQAAQERVRPALVRIHVVSTAYGDGRELKYESAGSGVIVSKDGYLVSNHHVAGHAIRLFCTLSDNQRIEAELIGTDPLTDIAVLKLLPEEPREFPVAAFGDSDFVEVGDSVLAMGSPMALSQSVTKGVVINTKMVMPELYNGFALFDLDGENVGSVVRWIAHDAAIYGGNSGGALVNLQGEVIGINEIQFGLSGAIPGNLARKIARQLIDDGAIRRSWIGLDVQPLLKHAAQDRGVLVSGVLQGTPAEKAGFRSGDILVSLDGVDCTVRYAEELPLFNQHMVGLPVSHDVPAVVLRDGEEVELMVRPTAWEEAQPKVYEFKAWGMTGCNISRAYAMEFKLTSRDGVLVTSVRAGGPCGEAKPMIHAGHVIYRVGGQDIRGVEDFREVTDLVRGDSEIPLPTLVGFRRENQDFMTVVKVGIQEQDDPGLEAKKASLPAATQVITRELAEQLGDENLAGVRVTRVFPGSTAEKAGLQVGDFLLAVDGEPIVARHPEDYEVLPTMLRQYRIGATVDFSLLRNGEVLSLTIALVRAPKEPREMSRYTDNLFEFTVRDVSLQDELSRTWGEADTGVLVSSVEQGGWAAVGDLVTGDLIQRVNGEAVVSVEQLEKELEHLVQEEPRAIVIQVLRGIHRIFLELEPDWTRNVQEANR